MTRKRRRRTSAAWLADADSEWQAIDWSAHTRHVMVGGRRIRYTDIGAGPAIVLIHGQGGCWQWWLRVLPRIAAHARVLAVDLAGFGESEPVGTGDVFDHHVATIVGLLDYLGLAKAIIVGHSMGGLVSLQFAVEHPRRVSGLCLTNAGGANVGARRLQMIVGTFRMFDAVMSIASVPRMIATTGWLRAALFAAAVHDRQSLTRPLALEIVPRMAAPGFMQSLEAAAVAVNRVTPQGVRCPCLVVWGTRDRILPFSTGVSLASKISDALLIPLEDVGHCPMVEAPLRFSELLAEFSHDPVNGRPVGADLTLADLVRRRRKWWRLRERLDRERCRPRGRVGSGANEPDNTVGRTGYG